MHRIRDVFNTDIEDRKLAIAQIDYVPDIDRVNELLGDEISLDRNYWSHSSK